MIQAPSETLNIPHPQCTPDSGAKEENEPPMNADGN
jgi:hypothetical protein